MTGKEGSQAQALNIGDTKVAYSYLSNRSLNSAHKLFRYFTYKPFVKIGSLMAGWAIKIPLFKGLIKNTIFNHFCGGENVTEAISTINNLEKFHVHSVLDYAAEAQKDEEGFEMVKNEIIHNIKLASKNQNVKLISLKMTGLADKSVLEKLSSGEKIDNLERDSFERSQHRLDEICKTAFENNVVVYIDAEESWIQEPIDQLALLMMRKYNKSKAIVFNTFQMYRTDRLEKIKDYLLCALDEKFIAGIKTVRGAYLEKERERAAKMGYPSPVFDSKAATDRSFDDATRLCMHYISVCEICLATHNMASTKLLASLMAENKIEKDSSKISFSQLYGMSDYITFNLAQEGYHASKYLPYGTVETAIPYLVRRAEENSSISGQLSRELVFLEKEIKRRKAEVN